MNKQERSSELILNDDGSVYHLKLFHEQVADTVITVGDPGRVEQVSRHFDVIEYEGTKREFVTHTGLIGKKRITVISSGIGPDNIDIVLNELHILASRDLTTGNLLEKPRSLNIIRLGTSGTICEDIEVDSTIVSKAAFGLDNLLHFYHPTGNAAYQEMADSLQAHCSFPSMIRPYYFEADNNLLSRFSKWPLHGITLTAPGFYGPQGREVNLPNAIPDLIGKLRTFRHGTERITNIEMESAAIFGLASHLGHHALSVNVILANRATGQFSNQAPASVKRLISEALETICSQ